MSQFSLETHSPNKDEIVVRFLGEFQGKDVADFESEIIHFVKGANTLISFDFESVPYIDTSGIGVLIKSSKLANELNKKLTLKSASIPIKRVLKQIKIDQLLTIVD